jgi:hypothetical protein
MMNDDDKEIKEASTRTPNTSHICNKMMTCADHTTSTDGDPEDVAAMEHTEKQDDNQDSRTMELKSMELECTEQQDDDNNCANPHDVHARPARQSASTCPP